MYQNIIFIGGIHGVGKGTTCTKIQQFLPVEHLSASEVLKWSEVSPDISNKLVKDISDTQDRLIRGLQKKVNPYKKYILDGHFCLFDSNGKVNPVPLDTFLQISPVLVSVITSDPEIITKRLEDRDGRKYHISTIKKMQNTEIEHAQLVAERLKVSFIELSDDVSILIDKIKSI